MLTIAGNSNDYFRIALLEILGVSNGANRKNRQAESETKRPEKALLEVIRLLIEMNPDERTALVGLLKALG